MEKSLDIPPFPLLKWDDYYWVGSIFLPAWAGFQARLGSYGAESSTIGSDGSAYLNVITPEDKQVSPSSQQAAAYQHLIEQQEAIRDAILQIIFTNYHQWQEEYSYKDEDIEEFMPNIERIDQLKPLMGLSTARIFSISKNDLAYVGFEFGCTWDDEHGLGVMTHGNRVVEVGGADTAILEWIAEKDAKSNL